MSTTDTTDTKSKIAALLQDIAPPEVNPTQHPAATEDQLAAPGPGGANLPDEAPRPDVDAVKSAVPDVTAAEDPVPAPAAADSPDATTQTSASFKPVATVAEAHRQPSWLAWAGGLELGVNPAGAEILRVPEGTSHPATAWLDHVTLLPGASRNLILNAVPNTQVEAAVTDQEEVSDELP